MDKNSNPALSEKAIERLKALDSAKQATISGTVFKTLLFLALTFVAGYFGWQAAATSNAINIITVGGMSFVAFMAAIATIFIPKFAAIGGSVYALAQGYVLGAISQIYNVQYDGIVLQAVGLTGAIFFVSLWFFWAGLIKVTNKFRISVIIATLGVLVFYLTSWIFSLFTHFNLALAGGAWGIAISLVIVIVASLNLFLNYDMIQTMEKQGAPKIFEWYGAFALIVTIIWLYMSILRLMSQVRG